MKIVTWNINGIRTAPQPLKPLLDSFDADILCFQETKITRELLDEQIALVDGYSAYFSYSRKKGGYSGVVTYCKDRVRPVAAEEGVSGYLSSINGKRPDDAVGSYGSLSSLPVAELQDLDSEGRAVITQHKLLSKEGAENAVCVINVYCPRADKEREDRKAYKVKFCQLLQVRAEALVARGSHVIILGDLNISHRPIDTCDSSDKDWALSPSRLWLNVLLWDPSSAISSHSNVETASHRFIDTFRYLHPDQKSAYTCWSTATGARALNYGSRIDYILANADWAKSSCQKSDIMPYIEGSDHCPVIAEFNVEVIPSGRCPSLCTKWMPEFSGRQQKIHSFFQRKPCTPTTIAAGRNESILKDIMLVGESSLPTVPADPGPIKKKLRLAEAQISSVKTKKNGSTLVKGKPTAAGGQTSVVDFFGRKPKADVNNGKYAASAAYIVDDGAPMQIFSDTLAAAGKCDLVSFAPNEDAVTFPTLDDELNLTSSLQSNRSGCSDISATSCCVPSQNEFENVSSEVADSTSLWRNLLRGPGPPPLCTGHNQPCVLKTVKRSGPTRGRQFYMCAKPEGFKTDPNARCSFFKWIGRTSSATTKKQVLLP